MLNFLLTYQNICNATESPSGNSGMAQKVIISFYSEEIEIDFVLQQKISFRLVQACVKTTEKVGQKFVAKQSWG